MRTLATTARVTRASATVIASPSRTPFRTPYAAMARPPRAGAIKMGRRFNVAWTVNPIARRSLGSASPITAKRVGLAMLAQAMPKTRPPRTQGQVGASA